MFLLLNSNRPKEAILSCAAGILVACGGMIKLGWKVDHVISHTCPLSQRPYFCRAGRIPDPTENMLQELYEKLTFKNWHFGHFHVNTRVNHFIVTSMKYGDLRITFMAVIMTIIVGDIHGEANPMKCFAAVL